MQLFYHVSKKDLGESVVLEPRIPETGLVEEEGNIPHVCVSTTVFHCLRSILAVQAKNFHVWNIFDTCRQNIIHMESKDEWVSRGEKIKSPAIYMSKERAFIPPNCADFRFNKEHWYLKETKFNRVGFVDLSILILKGEIKIVDTLNELDGAFILNEEYKKIKVKK
jgi:hypothetical protein